MSPNQPRQTVSFMLSKPDASLIHVAFLEIHRRALDSTIVSGFFRIPSVNFPSISRMASNGECEGDLVK